MPRRKRPHAGQRRSKEWSGIAGIEDWTSSDADEIFRAVGPREFHQDFPNEVVVEAESTLLRVRGWAWIDPNTDTNDLAGDLYLIRQPQSGVISTPPTINSEFLSQQDILGHGFVASMDGAFKVPWKVDIKAKRILSAGDQITLVWGINNGGSAASLLYRLRFLFALP